MKATRLRRAVAGLTAVAALALTGCSTSGGDQEGTTFSGRQLSEDNRWIPSTTPLTDTDGNQRTLSDNDADLTLVFFGYTHCPDICGIVMSTIASAVDRLDKATADRVEVVFVTTDPARDDAKTLRTYLDQYDTSFQGLTGDLDDVIQVGDALKVVVEAGEKLPSGGYEVLHSDQVIGLDDQHEAFAIWTKETSPSKLADDIVTLLDD